jgi:hypothetical protein
MKTVYVCRNSEILADRYTYLLFHRYFIIFRFLQFIIFQFSFSATKAVAAVS